MSTSKSVSFIGSFLILAHFGLACSSGPATAPATPSADDQPLISPPAPPTPTPTSTSTSTSTSTPPSNTIDAASLLGEYTGVKQVSAAKQALFQVVILDSRTYTNDDHFNEMSYITRTNITKQKNARKALDKRVHYINNQIAQDSSVVAVYKTVRPGSFTHHDLITTIPTGVITGSDDKVVFRNDDTLNTGTPSTVTTVEFRKVGNQLISTDGTITLTKIDPSTL